MDAVVKKIRKKQGRKLFPLDDQSGDCVDPSELVLEEEESLGFAGTLTFAGGDVDSTKGTQVTDRDVSSYQVPYAGSYSSTCRVNFEVTSAEVIKNAPSTSVLSCHSGHVVYTITITSSTGVKDISTCIVRRYTDFEKLHKTLKKEFSDLLSAVIFPQKVFRGNFSRETIAKRSRAFEQYLTHLYSILEVRYSSEFTEFFAGEDYAQGMRSFMEGKYFHAITPLERYLPIMEKLYGNSHNHMGEVVCALVVSHARTKSFDIADTYATLAVDSLPEFALTVPLLQKLVQIRWSLGRPQSDANEKLHELKDKGFDVDSRLDLEQQLCKQLRIKSQ